jgi:sugar lactone lactonase YvrE/ABC-type Fe3+ transport system permease subunit
VQSNRLVLSVALLIALVIIAFPITSLLFKQEPAVTVLNHDSFFIIVQTFVWAVAVGLIATAIGWPLGLRFSGLSLSMRRLIYTTLLLTLAIPSYAIYYAWWQTWPAGSGIHNLVVAYDVMSFATKCTLALALVGWSWPIAALIAGTCVSGNDSMQLLHRVDGVRLKTRVVHNVRMHFPLMLASCVFIAVLTAANTTCFDLAQVHSIGNELRAIIATGGSITDSPMLALSSMFFAIIAAIVVMRFKTKNKSEQVDFPRTSFIPLLIVWIFLSGGPIIVGAVFATSADILLLFSQYGGDVARSLLTATMTASGCVFILFISSILHAARSDHVRYIAKLLDYCWIAAALLPATIVAEAAMLAWNQPLLDIVYRSPFLIVFAQLAQIGFLGSLAGRWVSSNHAVELLLSCDAPKSIPVFWSALRSRMTGAAIVVVALSMAMSMGEVAMTTQLSQPATNQPIAVALLNAMHYQRPQIVTSVILFFVVFAVISGLVVAFGMRKCTLSMLISICFIFVGCGQSETKPAIRELIPTTIIGGTGQRDGHFVTPRAADFKDGILVVIDKTGRLQRFDQHGSFLSAWSLPPTGNGFPTGVTLDDQGNIWIADTHGHRVRVLDPLGNELLIFGEYGTGDGQFLYPTDIAFQHDGLVLVSEYGGNDRISVFDHAGNFLHAFGTHGKGAEEFRRPQSIAVHPETNLMYITDSANHRIVVYDINGTLINTFGSVGNKSGELLYPYSIVVLHDGTLLVTEFGNNRLQQFNQQGKSLGVWGSAGFAHGEYKTPWGAVLMQDGVLVIDTGNNRLQLFKGFMM